MGCSGGRENERGLLLNGTEALRGVDCDGAGSPIFKGVARSYNVSTFIYKLYKYPFLSLDFAYYAQVAQSKYHANNKHNAMLKRILSTAASPTFESNYTPLKSSRSYSKSISQDSYGCQIIIRNNEHHIA